MEVTFACSLTSLVTSSMKWIINAEGLKYLNCYFWDMRFVIWCRERWLRFTIFYKRIALSLTDRLFSNESKWRRNWLKGNYLEVSTGQAVVSGVVTPYLNNPCCLKNGRAVGPIVSFLFGLQNSNYVRWKFNVQLNLCLAGFIETWICFSSTEKLFS